MSGESGGTGWANYAQVADSVLGGAISWAATAQQNKKSREFSEKMYQRQFDDNLELWHLQNQYNSPRAQMQRLQEAGLNPNLMYGTGSGANSASAPSPAPQVMRPNFGIPDTSNFGGIISSLYDLKMKKAQIDNLEEQNNALKQETFYKKLMSDMLGLNIDLETKAFDYSLEGRKESARKIGIENRIMQNRDFREAVTTSTSVMEAGERMLNMRKQRAKTDAEINHINQQIKNLKQDYRLRKLDEDLKQYGVTMNDPYHYRLLAMVLSEYMDPKEIGRYLFEDLDLLSPEMTPQNLGTWLGKQAREGVTKYIKQTPAGKAYQWWKNR